MSQKELDITTIVERRQRADLIQIYNIMHNIDKFDKINRFEIVKHQLIDHCFKYYKEITRQKFRENFKKALIAG